MHLLLKALGCSLLAWCAIRAEEPKGWAFQTSASPLVPEALWRSSAANPVDHFVQARLAPKALEPSPLAGERTLVRRLYFDLLGLPPSPERLRRYLADSNPQKWEALVDELLDSPHYGERWARHWLDVVHFGESHGYDKDKPRLHAWPYRDYVIRSFNSDKPYARFIQEQLAADILFPEEPGLVPALGFLAAGPWDFVGHVELPETKMDGLAARYNDRDDMVMNTFSSFMSLTVHCARCHDHKFDPISTREYYELQAVFAGVDRANRKYDLTADVARQRSSLEQSARSLRAELRAVMDRIDSSESPEISDISRRLTEARQQVQGSESPSSPGNGYHSAIEQSENVPKWVQVDLGRNVRLERVILFPARPTDFPDTPGFGFPRRFKVELGTEPSLTTPTLVFDSSGSDYPNPGDTPFSAAVRGEGRYLRVTALQLWPRTGDFVFALAEVQAWQDGRNLAAGAPVSALDSIEAGRWSKGFLVDGYSSRQKLQPENPGSDPSQLKARIAQLETDLRTAREAAAPPSDLARRSELQQALAQVEASLAALPKPQSVYAAANDFPPEGNFRPTKAPRPVHLLRRGEVKSPLDEVAPGALRKFESLPFETPDLSEGSRRAALARWLSHTNNLLARRSFVNRIWHYHFGRGLVDTPNDFGHMGSTPSHPELLDWLAHWFLEQGESTKRLHRLILTSHTWRQSSHGNPHGDAEDRDNKLLWRMNRARLDAESLRDSALFISGRIDLTMGGPSDQLFAFKDDHSPVYDYSQFDVDLPSAARRSIYRFIVRSVPDPLMDALDCADPSLLVPKRNTTLTALQALATLNNAFIIRQSEHLADRLERESSGLEEQISRAFHLALARPPEPAELEQFKSYAARHSLAAACRLILNLNEFMFVD